MSEQDINLAETLEYGYNVVFEKQADGIYVATVPTLNYIATYGETLDEAREMAKDMIALFLESLRRDGLEIPVPDAKEVVTERVNVALAL